VGLIFSTFDCVRAWPGTRVFRRCYDTRAHRVSSGPTVICRPRWRDHPGLTCHCRQGWRDHPGSSTTWFAVNAASAHRHQPWCGTNFFQNWKTV